MEFTLLFLRIFFSDLVFGKLDTSVISTSLVGLPLPCSFDEDSPHGLSSRSEEMAAVVPGLVRVAVHESDVGFVDQSRSLQSVAG